MAGRTPWPHHTYRALVRFAPVPRSRVARWMAGRRVFLVVSTGRTGTQWLADLLDRVPGGRVEHEPIPVEMWAHREAMENPEAADAYVHGFRLKEIYLRGRRADPAWYGEVNSALRRHVDAFRDAVPGLRLVHLVRDGRDVVRSLVSRHTWAGAHPVYGGFRPPPVDEVARSWEDRSSFERACWIWRWENAHMRERIDHLARLEDITTSYDAFHGQILAPLQLELEEAVWREARDTVKNRTREHELGAWDDWSAERKATFRRICADEMARYGYDAS